MRLFSVLLVMLLVSGLLAAKVVPMPGLSRPYSLVADDANLYISDGVKVSVYSLKDFRKITSFGREGEGPQEFKVNPGHGVRVGLIEDSLYINSLGKYSIYSKTGKMIEEKKTGATHGFAPFGKGYVSTGVKLEKDFHYTILNMDDAHFKPVKELARWKNPFQESQKTFFLVSESTVYRVYENHLYVPRGMDITIDVFDTSGKKVRTLRHDAPKRKVTEEFKTKVKEWFKQDTRYRKFYEMLKTWFRFPEYYPGIKHFIVRDGKVYIQTYNVEPGKSEFIILTTGGKFVKKVMLPYVDIQGTNVMLLYTVKNNKFFQLVENADTEEWELRISNIL